MEKEYDELFHEYENLSDTELADEFIKVDTYIQLVWSNTSDETSCRWDILTDMIHERFVEKHATSYMFIIKNKDLNK